MDDCITSPMWCVDDMKITLILVVIAAVGLFAAMALLIRLAFRLWKMRLSRILQSTVMIALCIALSCVGAAGAVVSGFYHFFKADDVNAPPKQYEARQWFQNATGIELPPDVYITHGRIIYYVIPPLTSTYLELDASSSFGEFLREKYAESTEGHAEDLILRNESDYKHLPSWPRSFAQTALVFSRNYTSADGGESITTVVFDEAAHRAYFVAHDVWN